MALDPRSKERLEALGRTLPQKLPRPESDAAAAQEASRAGTRGAEARGGEARHPLERAQDPAELFRALISASPDGSVPPHLLDQLRDLEAVRGRTPVAPQQATSAAQASRAQAPRAQTPTAQTPRAQTPGMGPKRAGGRAQRQGGGGGGKAGRFRGQSDQDQALYTAFAQLLLEDEGED
jgi:hypothetical protein